MENSRTTAARKHDDKALIEGLERAPSGSGSSGGNLARDVGSRAEEQAVAEPEGHMRVEKQESIDNDAALRKPRAR
ncbi:hypothetical protein GCM10009087_27600 [Sphingomonas oligophenolica]|uniref:Uncharacterized protein n=1 Tax=Sphingomonas oligophenolica TaxID=301154 RepID=A0ABU9Y4I8_9SPHN